ncbi:MAG: ferritin [Bdellovibrionales bacterium]|nr:ferritin [Bdellovibrionales bacterium]MCB0360796.1 ferritin [Bdellovibrionales bacterium]
MISDKLATALNQQINSELQAAYLYLAMSAYFNSRSLNGMAHWMLMQSQEELQHAMRIYKYLSDQGVKTELLELAKPTNTFSGVQDVFEHALANEKLLAEKLNSLAGMALNEKDNTTYSFLEWFLTEQVEEIATCNTILDKLKLIGESGHGLLLINNELGERQSVGMQE